eukprot:scaffold43089_cov23-Cyclotella_meneghiniana.AAC.1
MMPDQCASCGKADANLKACKACKLVKYCGVECQVAHRRAHKKACREKAKELFDVQLFTQPQRKDECPICMLTLPCDDEASSYMSCCGKNICNGCRYCLTRNCCPFCNTANPRSHEEINNRISERIENFNDPEAMVVLGSFYLQGQHGLPVDQSKAFELLQRACELGCAAGHYNLGTVYQQGEAVEINMKKAVHHYEIAATMGHIYARHNVGIAEWRNGNHQRAMKHFMISAKSGLKESLDNVKQCFRLEYVTKEDLEKTLRDYQVSCDETKSDQRDRAAVIMNARD